MRDFTKVQFAAALARHGMKSEGFMGYVDLGIEGHRIAACKLNAGHNRRAQLAYLLKCKERHEQLIAEENARQAKGFPFEACLEAADLITGGVR